jgi:hypothetical protein
MLKDDRELRRLVSQLPDLHREDFDFIMDSLSFEQREITLSLLAEFDGIGTNDPSPASVAEHLDKIAIPETISPWLAARINGNEASDAKSAEKFSITDQALATLRSCAVDLVEQPVEVIGKPSLITIAWRKLFRRKARN